MNLEMVAPSSTFDELTIMKKLQCLSSREMKRRSRNKHVFINEQYDNSINLPLALTKSKSITPQMSYFVSLHKTDAQYTLLQTRERVVIGWIVDHYSLLENQSN